LTSLLEKLETIEACYVELERQLSDPAVLADINEYRNYAKKHGELTEIVTTFREYKDICKEMDDTSSLLKDDLITACQTPQGLTAGYLMSPAPCLRR
jgi:peptide chain release factor 1